MTDPDESERLARLETRIKRLKGKDKPKPHQEESYSQAQMAWRMVIELVAGLVIGFGVGYGLDSLLGTIPVFLVLFTLLGLAAGVRTMMRSAGEIGRQQAGQAANGGPGAAGNENETADDAAADDKRVRNGD